MRDAGCGTRNTGSGMRDPGPRFAASGSNRTTTEDNCGSSSRFPLTLMPPPSFTPETLRFLRALKRNNDREWFRARRDRYERVVRAPMIAVIEQLALAFRRFAPELVASPRGS